jgi:hypothetical protein
MILKIRGLDHFKEMMTWPQRIHNKNCCINI